MQETLSDLDTTMEEPNESDGSSIVLTFVAVGEDDQCIAMGGCRPRQRWRPEL